MTADELEQTLTKFAERAVTAIVPRPRIRIAVRACCLEQNRRRG
jgi:hypothetical protein